MNKNSIVRHKAMRICTLIALTAAPLLAACDPSSLTWDEEVKLHDGKTIFIKRREDITASGFPTGNRGITKSYEFCYKPMGLYWKSKGMYQPEIFGIVDGKAYVKVPVHGPELCMLQGYPATNAIYFTWENNAWKKIPYEQFPKEVRRTNLLLRAFSRDGKDDVPGLVTVEQKEKRDSIYWTMKHNGWSWPVESITDEPGYRGDCERSKKGEVQTTNTADVFMPPTPEHCE